MVWDIPKRSSYTRLQLLLSNCACAALYNSIWQELLYIKVYAGWYKFSFNTVRVPWLSAGDEDPLCILTSCRRTVQLGYTQGVYERFPIQKLISYTPATQAGLYTGPGSSILLYDLRILLLAVQDWVKTNDVPLSCFYFILKMTFPPRISAQKAGIYC